MKKSIYTGIFCTILGLYTNTPANASIVTRGFLDQALTDYATNTALDLKANQSDLTDLSNKIGRLPSGSLLGNSPAMDTLFKYTQNTDTPVYPNSLSDLINQLYGGTDGAPSAISAILTGFDYSGFDDQYDGLVGVLPAMELGLNATTAAKTALATATEAKTAADANTARIGTLPRGSLIEISSEMAELFKLIQGTDTPVYPSSLSDLINQIYGNTREPGAITALIKGFNFEGLSEEYGSPVGILPAMRLGLSAKTAADANTTAIGTLPSGSLLNVSKGITDELYINAQGTNTPVYPTSLADFMLQIYGTPGSPFGVVPVLVNNLNNLKTTIGTLPDGYKTVGEALATIDGKIGTVPDGKNLAGMISETDAKIGVLPPDTTVAGMIGDLPLDTTIADMIGNPVLLNGEKTIIPLSELIVAGSNGQMVTNPITGATLPIPLLGLLGITAEVNKIGTLPSEYSTVGDALSMIDGKIGTLPDGETVANMLSWQEPTGLSSDPYSSLLFNTNENSKNPKTVKEAIQTLFQCNSSPGSTGPCLPVMAGNIFYGKPLSDEILNNNNFENNYPGLTEYKGLIQLTADIGKLPTVLPFYEYDANGTLVYTKYQTADVFGINNDIGGMLAAILKGFRDNNGHSVLSISEISTRTVRLSDQIGTLSGDYETVGDALSMLDGKIGTLPRGGLPEGDTAMYDLFKFTQGIDTPAYPASLSDLIYQLYGNAERNEAGAIAALLKGFEYSESNFSVEYDGSVGVLPAMELGLSAKTAAETAQETANRAKALAESNSTAIGALPDGYETVGAALSAIKGIAEEAKAAALAAIPDPKTEGSNGKYVLTVDIIGDNATYRWEPIDRGNTTTTTTTTE